MALAAVKGVLAWNPPLLNDRFVVPKAWLLVIVTLAPGLRIVLPP